MARVEVYTERVVVQLTASEKALSLHRRDIVIDRSAISSVLITDDPWIWLRGVRSPGTHLPGRLAFGTWRNLTGRDFALVRRGRPAVVIDVDVPEGAEENRGWISEHDAFSRVIISTTHAPELIQALRLEDDGAGEDERVFTTDTAE
ncbi:hypothetical protein JD276_00440 [Leucobacter sp. CSA1]|uniref:Uncharacterized protein n=1 Tax=Leucobacter chromiisoli TaxID=2796471 RepID=A0A934Q600_9MICO|nr:hypothetical protein [Leucobacter chromiisoli]MBK0417507.1 hypothetical protein [Leucobacter chromiisoli]